MTYYYVMLYYIKAEAAAEVGRRLEVEKGKLQAAEERAFSEVLINICVIINISYYHDHE